MFTLYLGIHDREHQSIEWKFFMAILTIPAKYSISAILHDHYQETVSILLRGVFCAFTAMAQLITSDVYLRDIYPILFRTVAHYLLIKLNQYSCTHSAASIQQPLYLDADTHITITHIIPLNG